MANTTMTPAQKEQLRLDIIAKQQVGQPFFGIVNEDFMAIYYNVLTAIQVEKTLLSKHDILTATSQEATTFAWAAGAYITRAAGERDAFREMFNSTGSVNPSLASIKAAFADIFSGVGGAGNRTHITAMSKRLCNRVEALSAVGTGTLISPAVLGFEGTVNGQFISNIINQVG